MAKIAKSLTVERAINTQEAERDVKVLTEVSKNLPSASRMKIFKKEDENKKFISSISVDELTDIDPHEYIKNKYGKKYGGGDYILELYDSDANLVNKSMISIIEEEGGKPSETREARVVNEALQMREDAFEKVKEAAKEKSEAEKTKYESAIENMNLQWKTIQNMYTQQIDLLTKQLEGSKDHPTQAIIQMNLERIRSDFENSKRDFELQISKGQEGQVITGKIFDLINTFIPLIINKSQSQQKDPIDELNKTIGFVTNVFGGKKDLIESIIENPEKATVIQRLLGFSTDGKKDFFSDIFENPMKAEMFKKLLGVEEKKDFIVELIENPTKFEVFKKVMGMDKHEELMKSIINLMGEKSVVPVEAPKDFLEQIVESKTKFETLKNIFQPSQPAKTFVELISTLAMNVGPQLVQAIQQVSNSMVTIELIKAGKITQLSDGRLVSTDQIQKKPIQREPAQPFSGTEHKEETKVMEESIEQMFETIIIDVASSLAENTSPEIFVDKIAELVVKKFKEQPALALKLMQHKNILESMNLIYKKIFPQFTDEQISGMSQLTIVKVTEKVKG